MRVELEKKTNNFGIREEIIYRYEPKKRKHKKYPNDVSKKETWKTIHEKMNFDSITRWGNKENQRESKRIKQILWNRKGENLCRAENDIHKKGMRKRMEFFVMNLRSMNPRVNELYRSCSLWIDNLQQCFYNLES